MPETTPPAPFSWDRDPLSDSVQNPRRAGDETARTEDSESAPPDDGGADASSLSGSSIPAVNAPAVNAPAANGESAPAAEEHRSQPQTSAADENLPRRKGVGVAALVLGIVALLLAVIPLVNYLAIVMAIVGLILGAVALNRRRRTRGLGIAGLVTSTLALVLSVVLAIAYTVFVVGLIEGITSGPTAEPAPAGPGSLADPVPVGTRVAFAGADGLPEWEITPGGPTLDATAIMTGAPYNNPPPPPGSQYAVLPLTITYVGSAIGSPYDIFVRFVTPDGTAYAAGDLVVVIPEPLIAVGDLAPGASGSGYVAVIVPAEAVATGAWEVSTGASPAFFFTAQ